MCGIMGILSKSNIDCRSKFEKGYKTIISRGIKMNVVFEDNLYLGYSRLPTDGPSNYSGIPKSDNDYLLYNGIISNTQYLVEKYNLSRGAEEFDTNCLFEGFRKYEESFLEKCRGMFSFVLVAKDKAILVRDTVGIKPLYYVLTEDLFAFSSEIKGLAHISPQIVEVLPGEIIRFNRKRFTLIKSKFKYKSMKMYSKNDLQICLKESILSLSQRYLSQPKTKRIGVLLSGGLDSSIILKVLVDNLTSSDLKRVVCLTVGLSGSSDVIKSKRISKELGVKCIHVKPYSQSYAGKILKKIIYSVESSIPRVIKVAILQDAISIRLKKMGVQVILSGEGADELFYGYERFVNGQDDKNTKFGHEEFYKKVFYYTLLQRFDRMFARRQIEGRVPYLDQEVIELSKKFSVSEKVFKKEDGFISKLPLRNIAKDIGLPRYIYNREKTKTMMGAMSQSNTEDDSGYMEAYMKKKYGKRFADVAKLHFNSLFSEEVDYNLSCQRSVTEESIMRKMKHYE